MNDLVDTSRQLAKDLTPGKHRLDNARLRDLYGVRRLSGKARAEIAASLTTAGLEVLSDPADEPLWVRKVQRAAAVVPTRSVPWHRRRWVIAVGGIVLLLIMVSALAPADEDPQDGEQSVAVTQTETTPAETAPEEPVETFEDAVAEADDDDYAQALLIAAALGDRETNRIRRKISRRLAARARSALRRGDRTRARALLAEAREYPSTFQARSARASVSAATQRASVRRRQARLAAQQRRSQLAAERRQRSADRAAQRTAARQAEEAAQQEATAPAPEPSVDTSGPSSVNYCGKRDGDGDGIFCEGE